MSHHCRNGSAFLWSLLLIADQFDARNSSPRSDDGPEPDCFDERADGERLQAQPPDVRVWRKRLVWSVAALGALGVLLARGSRNAPSPPEPVANLVHDVVHDVVPRPVDPVATIAADEPDPAPSVSVSVLNGLPDPLLIAAPEPMVLPSRFVVNRSSLADIPTRASTRVSDVFFGIGSTREDLIAAQGRPPTFSDKGGDRLWWGSSRVVFTPDGRVRSWVQGTPLLVSP
jgi:hypothetical protein